ncbi:MAG: hypothetical protein KAR42_15135 [candidate division Zixibacteria bacterium]|nr:hypothetical protein [candidate division Zixibacteria bacterium]
MAIRLEDEYTNVTPASASYPGGSFKNETAFGNKDGLPYEKKWPDDIQGILQKLLDAAGITPSGTPDTVLASDYYDALVAIFGFSQVYDDTGIADAYELALRSGSEVEDYQDGQVISFMATNTNTGAATAQIDALGAKDITYPDGAPLLGGEILDGSFISIIFNGTDDRLELWVWVPAAYDSVMTGDETFIYSYQKERVSTLDAGVLPRNFNPTGTFPNGAKEIVVNVGATDDIIFDSGDLAITIVPGDNVSFVFNGTSGSWEILEQPFAGSVGTFANNANGNPNISDVLLDVDGVVAESAWESVGPTGSGADNPWSAMDTVPSDADWVEIRVRLLSGETGGTPFNSLTTTLYARKTGGSQGVGTDNEIGTIFAQLNSNGSCSGSGTNKDTVGVDSSLHFDLHWTSTFTTTIDISLVLVGWGFNT